MRSELNEIKTNNDRLYDNHYKDEHNILQLRTKNESLKDNKVHKESENISTPVEKVSSGTHAVAEKKTIVDIVKLSTVAVSVVAASTVLPNITLFPDDLNVSQIVVEQTDTSLWYSAEFSNYDVNSDNVIVVLYNDFEKFESSSKVEEGQFISGEFMNLRPEMYYTLAIKNNNVTIKSKDIKMLKKEKEPEILNPIVNVFSAPASITSEVIGLNIDVTNETGAEEYLVNIVSQNTVLKTVNISNTDINGQLDVDMENILDTISEISIELVAIINSEEQVLETIENVPIILSKVLSVNVDSDIGKYETFGYDINVRDDNQKWSNFEIQFYDSEDVKYSEIIEENSYEGSINWISINEEMAGQDGSGEMQPLFNASLAGVRLIAYTAEKESEVIYEQDSSCSVYMSKLVEANVPDEMETSVTLSGHIVDTASRITSVTVSLFSSSWDELGTREMSVEEFNQGEVTINVNQDASLENVQEAILYIDFEYDYGDGNMGETNPETGEFVQELPSTVYEKHITVIHEVTVGG